MINLYRKAFIVLLSLLSLYSNAANYYISSSSGNDNNSGTSESAAVKTISKLNTLPINDGDFVYFKRGDKFSGQVDMHKWSVTYDAYGSGDQLPIISGAVPITGWTKSNGNIYVANASMDIRHLFINSKQSIIARQPNSGYYFSTEGNGQGGLFAAEASSNWIDANIRMRTSDWTWELRQIDNVNGTDVTLSGNVDYATKADMAFYLDNKLSFLDTENEWYYDWAAKKVYLFAPNGEDPNNLSVEGSAYEYGFKGDYNMNNIVIQHLQIQHQYKNAVWLEGAGAGGNQILSNDFYQQGETAISIMGKDNTVKGNYIDGAGMGIFGWGMISTLIEDNMIVNIATIAGYGSTGNNGGSGIVADNSNNVTIRLNRLDNLGNNGIRFNIVNGLVEKNIIKNPQQTHSDGAGIYCWSAAAHDNIVRNNFVYYPKGDRNGSQGGPTLGIYIDNDSYNNLLFQNTIVESWDGGILINASAHDNIVRSNVVYGCKNGQMVFADWSSNKIYGNRVARNVFYSLKSDMPSSYMMSNHGYGELASWDSNYYCNPYSAEVVRKAWKENDMLTLSEWQASSGQDKNSKKSFYDWSSCETSGGCDAPKERSILYTNETDQSVIYNFNGEFYDLDNQRIYSLTLAPYTSAVVIRINGSITSATSELYKENNADAFSLYPNPASGIINLNYPASGDMKITVRDIYSKQVMDIKPTTEGIQEVDISSLIQGQYLMEVLSEGKVYIKKFVVH